ncbi:hypothetical protein I6F13_29360 [Bradyrhizobium sp. IC4061]|nr:hypothetical protein [Bradyrhizobium sp. IC4061]
MALACPSELIGSMFQSMKGVEPVGNIHFGDAILREPASGQSLAKLLSSESARLKAEGGESLTVYEPKAKEDLELSGLFRSSNYLKLAGVCLCPNRRLLFSEANLLILLNLTQTFE